MGILELLAEQLKSGLITVPEWQAGVRDFIRVEYNEAMILQRGGREFVTQADWGYAGSSIKKQYAYLDNFAQDIAGDPDKWLNSNRLNGRLKLYNQSGYSALEDFKNRDMRLAGWTDERNILGAADHCSGEGAKPGCIEVTGMGWRPIGTLPKIGARLCSQNCKCHFEYRRKEGNKWIIESEM